MIKEFNELVINNNWSLVLPSFTKYVNSCKWIFKVKRKLDSSVERYKARLVAKDFHQRPGLDYQETFTLVIKPTIIRTVLCIALTQ